VAIYVLLGRAALVFLPEYQQDLENILSEQIQVPVQIQKLSGRWAGFDPVIDIDGLSINGSENAYVGRVRVHLSFMASIYALAPRFKSIVVEHSEFTLFQNEEGSWKIAGFNVAEGNENGGTDLSALNSLFNGAAITLLDNAISLRNQKGKIQTLSLPSISLSYRDDKVYASGKVLQEDRSQTLLNFSLEGQGVLTNKDISGTLYLEARSSEFFDRVLKAYQWEQVSIQNIDASTRLWLSFNGLKVVSLQGDIQVRQINWKAAEISLPPILNAATSFHWSKTDQRNSLLLNGLGLSWAGKECLSADIQIISQLLETEIKGNHLDVQCISSLAAATGILPNSLQDRLDVSLPAGLLKNIRLTIRQENKAKSVDASNVINIDEKPFEPFNFEAELENVSLEAYSGTPLVKGVDGYIYADSDGGGVYFDSKRFELGFPSLFGSSWSMKRTEGAVSWLIKDDDISVYSEGLRLTQFDDSLVYGDFILRLNPADKEDYLSLSLGMQDIAFKNASSFVPGHIVGEGLNSWLDKSLISGVVSEGIYVGYGSIEDDAPENSFTSSIYLKSHQGELMFSEGWPNLDSLNADINLQNSELIITADNAKINGTELVDLSAIMLEAGGDEAGSLTIKAQFQAGEDELDYWLKESPIATHTLTISEQLELQGGISVKLGLDVPIEGDADVDYLIESTFESASVKHLASDLLFEDVNGALVVSSLNGVSAQDIQAQFFGQQATVDIETRYEEEPIEEAIPKDVSVSGVEKELGYQTVISIDSGVRIENLLAYLDQNEVLGLSGGLNYHAELSLPNQDSAYPYLTLTSDLRGVSYSWPEPLFKDPLEERQLALNLLIKPDQMYLNLNLHSDESPTLESELLFVGNKFTFGEVLIGGATSRNPDITGLNVIANIDELLLEPWLEFVQNFMRESANESESDFLKRIDLNLKNLSAYGQNFEQTDLLFTKPAEHWQLDLSGDSIQGRINIPSEKTILDIQLEHIILAAGLSDDDVLTSEEALKSEADSDVFDPRLLPEMTFSTKKLVYNTHNYGSWRTHVMPSDQGSIFSGLKGNIKGTTFDGQLNWKYDDSDKKSHTSILTLEVQGDKVEELTKSIGRPPLISSEKFNASIGLVWPDDPLSFELANVSGNISLAMENGFLNTEDAKTGALRLFGILNAESIVRRLKLDFSDLYKSGVGYDEFSVKATINQGLLTLNDPLLIDGPSSSYVINGSVDLSNETLDMDMLVELPFVQNLPLAALILGAPQIGGVVWVVDKLLGEPLSAITTARYDITGSWDDPKMELHQAMNASKKDRSKERSTR